ncbi:MAG: hypothetical protein MI684_04110, partial [Chlorobiales bacterium]|nr:hypothetical protein [Chlorobiales bacterium]
LSKKGKIRKTDLRQCVASMAFQEDGSLAMHMLPYNKRHIRPTAILNACFNLTEEDITLARIKKMKQG